jgi:hypothetical protein
MQCWKTSISLSSKRRTKAIARKRGLSSSRIFSQEDFDPAAEANFVDPEKVLIPDDALARP